MDDKGKPVRYRIHTPEEIGIHRMVEFSKEAVRMAYGHDMASMIASHLKIKKLLNELKFADCAVEVHNQLHRLGDLNQNRDATLWACTLFVCTSDENRTKIPTDADRNLKIEHWNNAGIPYSFFVRSLGTFDRTLKALYEIPTPTSHPSGEEKTTAKAR